MHMILSHDKPDDFVISTGISHTIRDLRKHVFAKLGMDYKDYVTQDPKYMRP
jgi:GDPmannose 4,6-dehydratase